MCCRDEYQKVCLLRCNRATIPKMAMNDGIQYRLPLHFSSLVQGGEQESLTSGGLPAAADDRKGRQGQDSYSS